MRELVTRAIEDRSQLIADALTPRLQALEPGTQAALTAELARYSGDGTVLKLMLQPAGHPDPERFFFVASGPRLSPREVEVELDELRRLGILQRLAPACIWDVRNQIRYRQADGSVELLTALIPVRTPAGCWVLTSTHATSDFLNTSIGRPYWETREIRVAAAIYLALAVLVALVAVSIRLSLRRFREVATEIGQGRIGDYAFSQRNVVPELASVAADFDKLVQDLRRVSQEIREAAEDKAHSFKTPLATIRSALEPVRRAVPGDNGRARRALEIIDNALARVLDLVVAAQRQDIRTAALIDAPRPPVDLSRLVSDTAAPLREVVAARTIRLVEQLEAGAVVRADRALIEEVLQNVLENAVSFAPPGSAIVVTLRKTGEAVELLVEDEGPGVDPDTLPHLFERYFSSRPRNAGDAPGGAAEHAGLGLWVVRRNVEALGGTVTASNRLPTGLCIAITLPRAAG